MTEDEKMQELLAMTPGQRADAAELMDYGILRIQNAALLGLVAATTMPEFVESLILAEMERLKAEKADKYAIAGATKLVEQLLHALQANRNRQ